VHREQYHSYLGIPLLAKNAIVGVIEVVSRTERNFSTEDLDWIISIGNAIGIAIDVDCQAKLTPFLH
jgi:signal transduction protein with GAF and PtsI domain